MPYNLIWKCTSKRYVFATDEEEQWHQLLADWCSSGRGGLSALWKDVKGDALEQARRNYGRQHYVTHLFQAKAWDSLWAVLDDRTYGRFKLRFDPSTRSYAQDLDLGRQAAVREEFDMEQALTLLPQLWRYSLLRCSLASYADNYPDQVFAAMILNGQEQAAIGLAELLTEPEKKARVLRIIGKHLAHAETRKHESYQILMRAGDIARRLSDPSACISSLRETAETLAANEHFAEAEQLAHNINDPEEREEVLCSIVRLLAKADRCTEAERIAHTITNSLRSIEALNVVAVAFADRGVWVEAERIALAFPDETRKVDLLRSIAVILAGRGEFAEANYIASARLDEVRRADVLRAIAVGLAQAGEFVEAENIARTLADDLLQGDALREIAVALAKAGQLAEAERIAHTIADDMEAIEKDGEQARRLRKQADRLAKLAPPTSRPNERAAAYEEIASLLEEAQQADNRRSKALQLKIPQAEAFQAITLILVEAGHLDQAERAALAISNEWRTKKAPQTDAREILYQESSLRKSEAAVLIDIEENFEVIVRQAEELPDDDVQFLKQQVIALQTEALRKIISAHIRVGQFSAGERLSDKIDITSERILALYDVAQGLIEADKPAIAAQLLQATIDVVNEIEPTEQIWILCRASQLWMMISEYTSAGKLLEQAIDLAQSMVDVSESVHGFYFIAQSVSAIEDTQIRKQLIEKLIVVANCFNSDIEPEHSISILIECLASSEHWSEVEIVIQATNNAYDRVSNLAIAAHKNALSTNVAISVRLLERLTEEIRTIDDNYDRATALRIVAHSLAEAGDFDHAALIVHTISDIQERIQALCTIVAISIQSGQQMLGQNILRSAENVIDEVQDIQVRAKLLCIIAYNAIKLRNYEFDRLISALTTVAHAIDDSGTRSPVLYAISALLTNVRRWEEAYRIAKGIQDRYFRIQAIQCMAQSLIYTKTQADAIRYVDEIIREFLALNQPQQLLILPVLTPTIAAVQGKNIAMQLLLQAVENTLKITDVYERVQALVTLAKTFYGIDERQTALQILRNGMRSIKSSKHDNDYIQIMGELIQALAEMGEHHNVIGTLNDLVSRAHNIRDDFWKSSALNVIIRSMEKVKHNETNHIVNNVIKLADDIMGKDERSQTLATITETTARIGDIQKTLRIIQTQWQKATTQEYILQLLPMARGLIVREPSLGLALVAAFAWVDSFLKREHVTDLPP